MAAPRRPSGGGVRRAPQDGRLEEINKVRAGGCELREGRGEAVGGGGQSRPQLS